jgi:hypothetical protein
MIYDDLPIQNGDAPVCYIKLPEGNTIFTTLKKKLLRMGQHVKPWNHTNIYEQIYSFTENGQPSLCPLLAMIHH